MLNWFSLARAASALKTRISPRPPEIALRRYTRQSAGERSSIHLRTDSDGSGLLLVNASRVMHLNPTAAFMARLALDETPGPQAIQAITNRYNVDRDQAVYDYADFQAKLDELLRPDSVCPIHDLDLEITAPFSARPSAPYRMDLALTYRCNNDCHHCYNARSRQHPELSTAEWQQIITRLWQIGIPHVVFTGDRNGNRPEHQWPPPG
jgi:hypothetical protein